jgi:5'(3')-deoxyribonucleotidase
MRKRFLVDADEVLGDFKTPMFKVAHDLFGLTLRSEDCDVWDLFTLVTDDQRKAIFKVIDQPGWCEAMEPKPGAKEAINEIRGFMDVYCVTSPWPSPTWVWERDNWLVNHFGFVRAKQIAHTSAKFMCKGDAFLDDHPDHVRSWLQEHQGGVGMVWHIPNTAKYPVDDLRVHTWDEVLDRLAPFRA